MRQIRIYNNVCTFNKPASQFMIICICRKISDRDIARHANAGMGFDEIQFELGVATQCGKCEGCARDVVAQCSSACPQANIQLADQLPGGSTWQISRSF